MPQKTNLNISPYYDDFDKAKNFYKVLFRPGNPVQARELTGLQSILQNQVESFGQHIFKEGSMVIPGGVEYNSAYFSVKVNPTHLGIDVTIYLNELIANNGGKGTRVRGQSSGIVANIKNFILPPAEGIDEITLFVSYSSSDDSKESVPFPNGETLILEESFTYGNTTLTENETILSTVAENASATGSSFNVEKGVYFMRGVFVDVPKTSIVLEPYSNKPSYRVGFEIIEEVVEANNDSSLYDNAKGFSNFAAPGADRFKISTKLTKKSLTDYDDTNFVELFRVREGTVKKIEDDSVYSIIKDYFAMRTFDESGNYAVEPFRVNLQNSLNDEISSKGLYTEDQLTDQGNTPTDDLMCVKLSPGKAYVRGFDVEVPSTVVDVEKPRDVKSVSSTAVPFNMGSVLKVNNVKGCPFISVGGNNTKVVELFNRRSSATLTDRDEGADSDTKRGLKIGDARVYAFNTSDPDQNAATSEWDLYLYDIQTYTILQITNTTTAVAGTRVRGLASGATGYLRENGGSKVGDEIILSETTGSFITGEELIFNEKTSTTRSAIKKINAYTTEDIKSVFQEKSNTDSSLASNFSADSVLYNKILPNLTGNEILTTVLSGSGDIVANASGASGKVSFAGRVGIKTDAIIAYVDGSANDPIFNRVSNISPDGFTITLKQSTQNVTGINGSAVAADKGGTFRIKVPRLRNLSNASIYSKLPKKNVSILNTSNSNLIISKQKTAVNINSSSISLNSNNLLDANVGVTSAFFEPFDEEKYSIHYTDGSIEPLTSDQVTLTNGNNDIKFNGLAKSSGTATVNVTLKKIGITSKIKNYTRSKTLQITRTANVSTTNALTLSDAYGVRVEDEEISLNTPDVVKIIGVYESRDTQVPVLDKLTFLSGLNLDTNTIIGEKIKGQDSRAIGQIVSRTANTVSFVYLNANKFTTGEQIKFLESAITTNLQKITTGNYVNRTSNYTLDKGHNAQYCGYSKIVRKAKFAAPANKLLIIFDKYEVPSNVGDFFTVNSYSADRYSKDIPSVRNDRGSDILDFRPRVADFNPDSTTGSPFAFKNRSFAFSSPYIITPNESAILGFNFYLPRIDKLVINRFEEVKLIKGSSAEQPAPPVELGESMEVAQITLPPYLYDVDKQPSIILKDNRRFTMRDIGALEKRIINLETVTTLNALELDTKSLQVRDANGLDRFKSGFAVNNFKDRKFINFDPETGSVCDVDTINRQLVSAVDFWSLKPELALDPAIDVNTVDRKSNSKLLDPNCVKNGDIITLDYTEVDWIQQPHATEVCNVNPFEVTVFAGGVLLSPPSDNWSRTIYIDNNRTESTGATWSELSNIISDVTTTDTDVDVVNREIQADQHEFEGNHRERLTTTTITTTNVTETAFTNVLEGPSREFDYVESVKISSNVDPFMRSRNVYFAANGLKPDTRHYHYLDNGIPDIVPKVIEISMTSGSFLILEDASVELNGEEIGYIRIQKPNHKFGDSSRPDIGAGLGSLSVLEEVYTVDIYDRSRPAPSDTYSATSNLLNIDVSALADLDQYYGYLVKGAKITGKSSGAVATISNLDLISDNWGDIIGAFFFRNANQTPEPPILFRTGTKTFKLTANLPGKISVPGSTALASDASGTFTGTGIILTQDTTSVSVRIPPRPPQRPNEINTTVNVDTRTDREFFEAPYRDPLAQSFRVDETGAFLTSFDVFFKSKDPNAKLFVELRTVELGTPTRFLVQDYAQVSLNPSQINTSDDGSVATTIKFPSPIYLEPKKEYALVFLSPSSDKYEMWIATMNEKTVKTDNLPDVDNVVVGKQYLGGSLFKSQNGTIWTPSQYSDLTFKLRKASFVPTGTVTFFNPPIEAGNFNTQLISDNALHGLPRKLKLKIKNGTRTNTQFPIGRKISSGDVSTSDDDSITGFIEGQGSNPTTSGITLALGGSGYSFSNTSNIPIVSLTGGGTGATATVNESGGVISSLSNISGGSGYKIGDVVTIDHGDVKVLRGAGFKGTVTAINTTFDTLYLTDVQGQKFLNNEDIITYGSNNDTRAVVPDVKVDGDSVQDGELFGGNTFEVTQYNHAHHSGVNKIEIKGIQPDTPFTELTEEISADKMSVSVATTAVLGSYNGISTDRGDALLGSEIISYTITPGSTTLTINGRGRFNTTATSHPIGENIQTYEANGVSLVGINTIHTVSTSQDTIDSYYINFDQSSFTEPLREGKSLTCFKGDKSFGGNNTSISQNHQFSTLSPKFNIITPGDTQVSTSVRTVSGTSSGGSEVSFLDQGFEPTILNQTTFFPNPRLVASKVNEEERLSNLPRNKSLTLVIDMKSNDPNLSPEIDLENAMFELGRNKINNPIGADNYATDDRTNKIKNDPHGSVFVSQKINLAQPADSLKVIVGANVPSEADFRVFYRLFSADSSEVSQSYRPFPGFNNMIDDDGDGFKDRVINDSNNDGRADAFVSPSRFNEFSEYQFTADGLEDFDGFSIKIVMTSTNESAPVKLKDFRAIAIK